MAESLIDVMLQAAKLILGLHFDSRTLSSPNIQSSINRPQGAPTRRYSRPCSYFPQLLEQFFRFSFPEASFIVGGMKFSQKYLK